MHWDINDLRNKLIQINERIKSEKDEKTLLTLRADAEILINMINYISYNYVVDRSDEYRSNLFSKNNDSQTINFLRNNQNSMYDLISNIISTSKLPACILPKMSIKDDKYYDLVDKFFKLFDGDHSTLYRDMVDTNRIEINTKGYGFDGEGVTYRLNTQQTSYIASMYDGTLQKASILPHEVGHARQFIDVHDITTEINLFRSLFRETYSKFIEYVFNDFLKETKYRKYAFDKEWVFLDGLNLNIEHNSRSYYSLNNYIIESDQVTNAYRYLYSTMHALYFLNMYREDSVKCMKEINKFNDMVGRVSDEELIRCYSNETLLNSLYDVKRNYIRTYRRR